MKNTTEADAAAASALRGVIVMFASFGIAFHVVRPLTSPNEIHVAEELVLLVAIALAFAWLLVFKPQTRAMRNLVRLFQFFVFASLLSGGLNLCVVAAVMLWLYEPK